MASIFYFPLVDYSYVRKKDIEELSFQRITRKEVDTILENVESSCNHFHEKEKFVKAFKICFSIFGVSLLFGMIFMIITIVKSNKVTIVLSLMFLTIGMLVLSLATIYGWRNGSLDDKYKKNICSVLNIINKKFYKSGLMWQIGADYTLLELIILESIDDNLSMLADIRQDTLKDGNKVLELQEISIGDISFLSPAFFGNKIPPPSKDLRPKLLQNEVL